MKPLTTLINQRQPYLLFMKSLEQHISAKMNQLSKGVDRRHAMIVA